MFKERVAFIRDRLMVIAGDEKAREHFDIDQWVAQSATTHAEPVTAANMAIQHDCGFAGCILGWASHERWFEPWGYEVKAWGNTIQIMRIGEKERHPFEPERPLGDILDVDPVVTTRIIYGSHYEGNDDPIDEAIELLTFLHDKGEGAFINRYV
jgi:hypothetical protein